MLIPRTRFVKDISGILKLSFFFFNTLFQRFTLRAKKVLIARANVVYTNFRKHHGQQEASRTRNSLTAKETEINDDNNKQYN